MADQSWKEFWERGESYLRVAEKGLQRPDKFNAAALYNIVALAIEGLFMGRFVAAGTLPRNHTLLDLVEEERELGSLPDDVAERLIAMDAFQNLCSLAAYERKEATREDIVSFVSLASQVRDILSVRLPST